MMPVVTHNAFVLRNISGGQDGCHASDQVIFLRHITFDANSEAVCSDIQLRPGARVDFVIFSNTTACSGTDGTSVFGTADISIKDGNICLANADVAANAGNESPAVNSPNTSLANKTFLVMFIVKQSDLGVL